LFFGVHGASSLGRLIDRLSDPNSMPIIRMGKKILKNLFPAPKDGDIAPKFRSYPGITILAMLSW
jgi:hypothetical protein